jgi:hypothetical protein
MVEKISDGLTAAIRVKARDPLLKCPPSKINSLLPGRDAQSAKPGVLRF